MREVSSSGRALTFEEGGGGGGGVSFAIKVFSHHTCSLEAASGLCLQGYLAHQKRPPPQDPPRTLPIGLRWGPRGVRFLVSEVPLYSGGSSKVEVKSLKWQWVKIVPKEVLGLTYVLQEYLAHKKTPPPRTPQEAYA